MKRCNPDAVLASLAADLPGATVVYGPRLDVDVPHGTLQITVKAWWFTVLVFEGRHGVEIARLEGGPSQVRDRIAEATTRLADFAQRFGPGIVEDVIAKINDPAFVPGGSR